jgi:integrase
MRNVVAAHLSAHPSALVDGDSAAPPAVARLIAELGAVGMEGLAAPRCLDCGNPRKLTVPVEGGRVCDSCGKRRRAPERCVRCGKLALPVARDENRDPLCSTCWTRTHVPPIKLCTVCGVSKTYRTGRRRGICSQCADRSHATCASCGLAAPIPEPGAVARCARCALRPPESCRLCGEPTIGRDRDGRPRCERCYRRPVGTCGRCGRVRAIIRRAVDGDPDLCAICWTGPTVICEGCGRLRPCTGKRRGRMLCKACRPVAPQTCAHCGRERPASAHWPEGPVCSSCYARALSAENLCPRCGQTRRLLHYPGFPEPVCRDCAGAGAEHVCGRCGAEESLHTRGLCARCVLDERLTELLGERPQRLRIGLQGLFDALHAVRSPKDTVRWLDRSPATPVLARIARGELPCSHETFDRLPASAALRHIEGLLVTTGALGPRDPVLARLERWIEDFLGAREEESALRAFARWVILRRYRRQSRRAPVTAATISSAKTELRSVAAFLDWLADRQTPLSSCRQADVDAWLAGPRPDRYCARSFARWASGRGLMPTVDFPTRARRGSSAPISDHDRLALARRLIHDPDIKPRDRLTGILIILLAQPVSRVCRLTVDDVAIDGDNVTIRLAETAITMPEPLAGDLRALVAKRRGRAAIAVPDARWLFPGWHGGQPITEQVLSRRLKRLGIDCFDARRTALLQLAGEIPAALLADLLGVHVATATKWAEIAGRPWADYAAQRAG